MVGKTVFFSDLDRTVIYSKTFLKDSIDSICVEKKDGKEISYMTKEALSILGQLKKESTFIPVTTRSLETISRIDFIREDMPEWMICDNGAHIYHNGKQVEEWEAIMKHYSQVQKTSLSRLIESFPKQFQEQGLKEIINRENLYLILKFEEMTGEVRGILEVLNLSLRKKGYRIDVNSRKAYVLPDFIKKEDAIAYLMNEYGYGLGFTISAGDSLMDLEMLLKTDYAIAPKHKSFLDSSMEITKEKGMKAGEEILHYVQHICRYWKSTKDVHNNS